MSSVKAGGYVCLLAAILAGCGSGLSSEPSNVKRGDADAFKPTIMNACQEPQDDKRPNVFITNTNNCFKDNTSTVEGESEE